MLPITKNARVAKKAMPAKKKTTRALKQAESETAGENASCMKSILTTLTAVLSILTQNQDEQDWPDARLGRNVSFSEDGPAPQAASMSQESPGPVFDKMQPADFPDVAKDVCEWLAQHLHGTSAPFLFTDDETGSDDEGAAPHHCRTTIISRRL